MRGQDKQKFLDQLECHLDQETYLQHIRNLDYKDLIKLLKRKKSLIKKNSLFIRKIKDIINQQIKLIQHTILFNDVEVVYVGDEITIGRL